MRDGQNSVIEKLILILIEAKRPYKRSPTFTITQSLLQRRSGSFATSIGRIDK